MSFLLITPEGDKWEYETRQEAEEVRDVFGGTILTVTNSGAKRMTAVRFAEKVKAICEDHECCDNCPLQVATKHPHLCLINKMDFDKLIEITAQEDNGNNI